jgi:hypothetical protein
MTHDTDINALATEWRALLGRLKRRLRDSPAGA